MGRGTQNAQIFIMEYTDIMQLVALYAGFTASVFAVSYGAISLYKFFKDIADPNFRTE